MDEGYRLPPDGKASFTLPKPPRGGSAIEVLPNGIDYKPAEVATLAKYFYRFEAVSDGQRCVQTIGFQTHRELVEYLIATETDPDRANQLCNLLPVPSNFEKTTDSPTIREASE